MSQDAEIALLFNLARTLFATGRFRDKATHALELTSHAVQADRVLLWLLNDDRTALNLSAAVGPGIGQVPPLDKLVVEANEVVQTVLGTGEAVLVENYAMDPRMRAELVKHGVKCAAFLPISVDGVPEGMLILDWMDEGQLSSERVMLLRTVASELGNLVYNTRLAESLRSSEGVYRSVIDLTGAAVVRFDLQGNRTYANEVFLAGHDRPATEIMNGKLGDMNRPEDAEKLWKHFHQCIQSGEPVTGILTKYESKSVVHHTRSDMYPIIGSDGEVSGIQVTSIDVTEMIELQEQILRSQELHRSLEESTNAAVVRLDLEGRRTFVNEVFVLRHGKPAEELLKGVLADQMLPEDREREWTLFRECIECGKSLEGITSRHEKDGRTYHTRANFAPILDTHGNVTGVQVTSVDITDLMDTQERLRQAEEFYQSIVDGTQVGVILLDLEGNRVFINDYVERITGLDRDTFLKGRFGDIIVPRDRERALKAFDEVLSTGEVREGLTWGVQVGDEIRWHNNTMVPRHDANGRIVGIQITYVDLTEQMHIQEELRHSQELFRSLVESTGSVVVRVNREGQRTFVGGNTDELFDRDVTDYLSGRFGDNNIPEDRRKALKLLEETFLTGKPVRNYVTRQMKGNQVRYVSANWEPITDAHGNVVEVQTTSTDITDQLMAQRERQEAQRLEALGSMAGGIAHDVNNILSMVSLWANVAASKAQTEETKEALKKVVKAAMDGAETMRRLRRFSKPIKPDARERFDLNDLVSDAILFTMPFWKDESEAKDIFIQVEQSLGDIPLLLGNPAELREMLVNLIINAIEAMPYGGNLGVKTWQGNGWVYLSVSDTGVGIPESIRDRIFEPYFSSKDREGSGLGLSTVNGIVSSHGGTVHVESAVGTGTTFTVKVPVPKDTANSTDIPTGDAGKKIANRVRILVVDDEEMVREAIEAILREAGHTVIAANGGIPAIEEVERHSFDVVLLDLGMSDMNGYQVAGKLKDIRPEMPIILVSGWQDDADLARMRRLGVTHVVSKPFQPDELLNAIRRALSDRE